MDLLKFKSNKPVEILISINENNNRFIETESVEYPIAIFGWRCSKFLVSEIPVAKVYFFLIQK